MELRNQVRCFSFMIKYIARVLIKVLVVEVLLADLSFMGTVQDNSHY